MSLENENTHFCVDHLSGVICTVYNLLFAHFKRTDNFSLWLMYHESYQICYRELYSSGRGQTVRQKEQKRIQIIIS